MPVDEIPDAFHPEAGSRVLVVEDDQPLAHLLRQQLEARSCAVTTANDGEAARQTIQEQRFDLVILDLNLPKLDGVSLLRQIRPLLRKRTVLAVCTGA